MAFLFLRARVGAAEGQGHERLTDGSIACLTRHDTRLADAVTREEHSEFLTLIGIDVFEQTLRARGRIRVPSFGERLPQLARWQFNIVARWPN